ncbi:MAG TPA: AraC family transcriptional regulator [Chryseolinea sp.]|nr:AraC family transcriptional regulator [Chryseolinea sp.]
MQATDITLQRFSGIKVGNYKCHACAGTRSGIEHARVYTIIFLLKGSFRHSTFRQSDFLTSELILFKKPGFDFQAIHEHYIHDDCFYIEFDENVLEELSKEFSPLVIDFLRDKDRASLLLRNDPSKHFIIWNLQRGTSDILSSLEFQNTIVELITSVLGAHCPVRSSGPALHDSIDRAKHFILQNHPDDLSIEDIAKASHVSPFHFSRVFKRNTNYSPHQFLREIRLYKACRLLLDSRLNVSDISYASGFPNADYFVTLFKKKVGMTPTSFRISPPKTWHSCALRLFKKEQEI